MQVDRIMKMCISIYGKGVGDDKEIEEVIKINEVENGYGKFSIACRRIEDL